MNRVKVALLALTDYAVIRNEYTAAVWGAIQEYLTTDGVRITRFKSQMKRVMVEDFVRAYEQGFTDAGSEYPGGADPADIDWITGRIDGEVANIDNLFYKLKELKELAAAENDPAMLENVAYDKAEGYARTLDGIYSEGKMRGGKNVMLTFVGNDGQESCPTCQRLKGKRHKASYWLKRGLTIYRGNDAFECGCWQCQHFYITDKGEPWTF